MDLSTYHSICPHSWPLHGPVCNFYPWPGGVICGSIHLSFYLSPLLAPLVLSALSIPMAWCYICGSSRGRIDIWHDQRRPRERFHCKISRQRMPWPGSSGMPWPEWVYHNPNRPCWGFIAKLAGNGCHDPDQSDSLEKPMSEFPTLLTTVHRNWLIAMQDNLNATISNWRSGNEPRGQYEP